MGNLCIKDKKSKVGIMNKIVYDYSLLGECIYIKDTSYVYNIIDIVKSKICYIPNASSRIFHWLPYVSLIKYIDKVY
jgi:hypothetical protein